MSIGGVGTKLRVLEKHGLRLWHAGCCSRPRTSRCEIHRINRFGFLPWVFQRTSSPVAAGRLLDGVDAVQIAPFFLNEEEVATHGRKAWYDRVVEVDPGTARFALAADYEQAPPKTIAVLPFTDLGDGEFVVDKVSLLLRSDQERARWGWSHANRLRRAFAGDIATREFTLILRSSGIATRVEGLSRMAGPIPASKSHPHHRRRLEIANSVIPAIFLSASVPDPRRNPKYHETADVIAIRDAVVGPRSARPTQIVRQKRLEGSALWSDLIFVQSGINSSRSR
jgi:hypothetical protein